jgi:tripartite ATP-independent transporter DctM subunit
MTDALGGCLAVVAVLAAAGVPVGHALLAGATVYVFLAGADPALAAAQMLQSLHEAYLLLAVPLFILAANLMIAGTLGDRLMNLGVALCGRLRGGFGHADIAVSVLFAGMSGSAIADAAGPGRLGFDLMTRGGGYPRAYAAALTAASATVGPIIPPSIPMLLYAQVSGQSVWHLFLAGVVPGLMVAAVIALLHHRLAVRLGLSTAAAMPHHDVSRAIWRGLPVILLPAILLGGMLDGLMTPTESAAVAACAALILTLALGAWRPRDIAAAFVLSARQAAAVGYVAGSAFIFAHILAAEEVAGNLAGWIGAAAPGPAGFLMLAIALILLLGCVLDTAAIILVVLPLLLPTAAAAGVDPVHFGVVAVVACMTGLITPPYGMVVFVTSTLSEVSPAEIFRAVVPFVGALIAAVAILAAFPGLSLWLPRLAGYAG